MNGTHVRLLAALPLLLAATGQAQAPVNLPRIMTVSGVMALPSARPAEVIAYGEGESQRIELFLPEQRAEGQKLPVVVLIHGGCWQKAVAGRELVRPAATALAARGYAVWSIGYRRVDEEGGGYPGTYQDVATAIDSLETYAGEFGLDLSRLAFLGHSAGAHLALWAAARPRIAKESPLAPANPPLRPRGVVAAGGILDLDGDAWVIKGQCRIDPGERLVNPEAEKPYADTSPAAMLPIRAPLTLVHGVFDGVSFPELGLAFATAARRAGDQAEIVVAPVAGHFEVIAPGTRAFEQVAEALAR
ncbi:alpha/beta hydrolase, partial [Thermaurantiacus sp.]